MGEKAIIRLGDKTSHGGTVLEGHQILVIHGKPAAGVGHRVSCPRCSGSPVIVEGAVNASMMGISIAVEGMKTSCGATLIASQVTDTISVGSRYGAPTAETGSVAARYAGVATPAAAAAEGQTEPASLAMTNKSFDDRYKLIDKETGAILAHTEYAIRRASGAIEHGVSDEEGKTHMLSSTKAAEDIDIYV